MLTRRRFIANTSVAFAALAASGCIARESAGSALKTATGYGPLVADPEGVLDLPEGFHYRLLSSLGDPMADGGTVPDKADGMGSFELPNGDIVLVRNHELVPTDDSGGVIGKGFGTRNGEVVPGGTTHLVLDPDTLAVKNQFRSLGGTIRNCAGRHNALGQLAELRGSPGGTRAAKIWQGPLTGSRLGV